MFKGFYNLTSGMLSQQRNLNVVANNMVNVSTSGFKGDRYVSSTFGDVLISRIGNLNQGGGVGIGRGSYIRASSEIATDFTQGVLEPTGIPLDFAIEGDGFFAVRDAEGETGYTRAGSFSLDEEGYLCLPGCGRVLDEAGQPIMLQTDKIRGDENGRLYSVWGGYLGQLGVYTFPDNGELGRNGQGLFTGAVGTAAAAPTVHNGYLERANVELVQLMAEMLTSQRALQSAAQVTKMYDQLMTKAASDLGRL